jgi:hypothetical protein
MVKGKKAPAKRQVPPPKRRAQPPSEEDLGGGDICSLEEQPSIADDKPLDLRLLYRRATRPPSPPRLPSFSAMRCSNRRALRNK